MRFVLSSCWWLTLWLVLLLTLFVTTHSQAMVMGLLSIQQAGEVVHPFSLTLSSMSCVHSHLLVLVAPMLLGIVAHQTQWPVWWLWAVIVLLARMLSQCNPALLTHEHGLESTLEHVQRITSLA